MLAHKPKIKLIGRRKFVTFPIFEINKVEAKIDTGAFHALSTAIILFKKQKAKNKFSPFNY
jgi:hypothetical protein